MIVPLPKLKQVKPVSNRRLGVPPATSPHHDTVPGTFKLSETEVSVELRTKEDIHWLKSLDSNGRSPLHIACLEGNLPVVQKILSSKEGRDSELILQRDNYNNPPILSACVRGNPLGDQTIRPPPPSNATRIVGLLLDPTAGGADLGLPLTALPPLTESSSSRSVTASPHVLNRTTFWSCLHWSCFHGDETLTSLLLEHGVRYDLMEAQMLLPIDIAGMRRHRRVVGTLLHFMRQTPPSELKATESVDILRKAKRKDLMATPRRINQAVTYWASAFKFQKTLRSVKSPQDGLQAQPALLKQTALHAASQAGHVEPLKLLLERGLTSIPASKALRILHHQDVNGNTCLHLAALHGHSKCVRLLLAADDRFHAEVARQDKGRPKVTLSRARTGRLAAGRVHTAEGRGRMRLFCIANNDGATPDALMGDRNLHTGFLHQLKAAVDQRSKTDFVLVIDGNKASSLHLVRSALSACPFFQVAYIRSKSGPYEFILIHLPDSHLHAAAEATNLRLLKKDTDALRDEPFTARDAHEFLPFRSRDRIEVVHKCLSAFALPLHKLLERKDVLKAFPVHDRFDIDTIRRLWRYKPFRPPYPLSHLRPFLMEGPHLDYLHLHAIRNYFGERVAFSCAWLAFNCVWLLPLIPFGLALTAWQIAIGQLALPHYLLPAWGVCVSVWATVVVERWKRKRAELCLAWRVGESEISPLRRQYKGNETVNWLTEEVEPRAHRSRRYVIAFLTLPVFFGLMAALLIAYVMSKIYQRVIQAEMDSGFGAEFLYYGPTGVYSIVVVVINLQYRRLAFRCADMENQRTQEEYDQSVVSKTFLFVFLNSYLTLFYSLFRDRRKEPLLFLVICLMICTQAASFFTLHILPKALIWRKRHRTEHKMDSSSNDKKQPSGHKIGFTRPHNQRHGPKRVAPVLCLEESGSPVLRDSTTDEPIEDSRPWGIDQVEHNFTLLEWLRPTDDFESMIVQFGYVVMFSAIFPLAPLLALIGNLLELRTFVIGRITHERRPLPERATGIGPWQPIYEFFSIFSVVANLIVLWFTENPTPEECDSKAGGMGLTHWVIVEHLLILVKLIVAVCVPNAPLWVTVKIDKLRRRRMKKSHERSAIESQHGASIMTKKAAFSEHQKDETAAVPEQHAEVKKSFGSASDSARVRASAESLALTGYETDVSADGDDAVSWFPNPSPVAASMADLFASLALPAEPPAMPAEERETLQMRNEELMQRCVEMRMLLPRR
ncbi:unnamed protein product [Vitrella brassicaformis CCMP3155]|uniref:Anoctamin transmembrane domain-containing protein n=1 Tax=Vitrella brassicaformis (strain CCMP3155) TaxID=1169540 RepID=A0A0G4G2M6_VITBC|nr:unnamed protein product [Vitrella brassicaformis CCMP3155]|eukprot:CEM22113.1 unnamed protein product [Vitrella brassicaformis CCMP3155]